MKPEPILVKNEPKHLRFIGKISGGLAMVVVMLFLIMPSAAFAKTGIIFVDASRSIGVLSDTFKLIMRQIASSARRSQNYDLYFCPIGKAETRGIGACVSSRNSDLEMRGRLGRQFTYRDQYTRIIKSLDTMPASAFDAASTLMIVSDMAPDHKIAGGQWAFSCRDMDDLIATGKKLASVLASGRHEKTLIVLLDWAKRPGDLLSQSEKQDPEALIARMKTKLSRKVRCNNPKSEDSRGNYLKAAAAMIYGLEKKFGAKLSVMTMNRGPSGNRNDAGLRIAACGLFQDFLHNNPMCGSSAPTLAAPDRTEFKILIDLERYSNERALKKEFKRVLGAQIAGQQCSGSRAIKIVFGRIDRNNPGRGLTGQNAPDFLFPVCQMRLGRASGIGSCEHPNNPIVNIESAAWAGFELLPNGQYIRRRKYIKIADGLTPRAARLTIVHEVRQFLERQIRMNHPPAKVLRTVRFSQKSPNCNAGENQCAAREGHNILAKYQCGASDTIMEAKAWISEVEGTTSFKIPKLAKNVKLFHRYSSSPNFDEFDETGLIAQMQASFAQSQQDASIQIPGSLFVGRKPKVKWPSELTEIVKKGKLSIRLKSKTAATYLQTIPSIDITGDEGPAIYQLPGVYEIRFDVSDPRLQSFVRPISLWKSSPLAGDDWEEAPSEPEIRSIDIRVKKDPFVFRSDGGDFQYQIGQNPNYLNGPKKIWPKMKSLIREGGRLKVSGKTLLRNSSNFLWALLSLVSANMDGIELEDGSTLADEREKIGKLAKAVYDELYGSGGSNEEIQRMVEPALKRIGLVDMNGNTMPKAKVLLKILLASLSERKLCDPNLHLNQRYGGQTRRLYNEWLIQSSIENRYRMGEGGRALREGTDATRLSQTPFTEKLRNRCRLVAAGTRG